MTEDQRLAKNASIKEAMKATHEKRKSQDNVYVVNRWEPTTQKCINCGKKHPMPQNERTFKCDCGLCMPRDLHSANRMVQEGRKLVPPEQREFMSSDWQTSILSYLEQGKSAGLTPEARRDYMASSSLLS